jgi:hypothetical protein
MVRATGLGGAGGGEGRTNTGVAGERQAQHHIVVAGQAVEVGGDGADHDGGDARAQLPCRRPKPAHRLRVEHGGAPGQPAGSGGLAAGEAGRDRPVGEPGVPVSTVTLEAVTGPVFRLGAGQRLQRPELCRLGLCLGGQRGVDLGNPPGHQDHPVPVQRHVVVALVPPRAVGRQAQQRPPEQWSLAGVDRLGGVGPHPLQRRGTRVGLGSQIDDRQSPVHVRFDRQHRLPLDRFLDACSQPFGVGDGTAQCRLERGEVECAVDIGVLGQVVDRVVGIEPLDQPDPILRGGQRVAGILVVGHGSPPERCGRRQVRQGSD